MTPTPPLSPLEARWLAEVVRRHEDRNGLLEDSAALRAARAAPPELGERILRRADVLGEREGWREAIRRWHGRARLGLLAAAVLALVFGFGAAAGVLGDGSRPVNVVWALGGLLGVHLASLLLWLLGMLLAGRSRGASLQIGGLLGRLWLRLVAALDRSPAAEGLPAALGHLLGRSRLATWGLGAITHGLWTLALAGAAGGVLLLLATRSYGFVWETTILPDEAFVRLTGALGSLPALIGFPVPDAATVAASGSAAGPGGMLAEAGRRAWAGWLLGALLVYGVLPRLLLTIACALLWWRGVRTLALDLALPGYARLRARLLPDSERIGVRDPAPRLMPRPGRHGPLPGGGGEAALVALELGADLTWPPPAADEEAMAIAAADAGRLDSREQRRGVLARFAERPPHRLLVAVDARATPDRGSLGLVAELADHAVQTRVWALGDSTARAERLALWRRGLAGLGFAPEALITDAAAARAWLLRPGPETRS